MATNPGAPRPLRLGMVGGGRDAFIGAVHRMAARLDGRYDLVAGALSATAEKSRASGRDLGLAEERIYDDFVRMAAREGEREDGIDVVAIVTPNHMHVPVARSFLNAGIHVICDKPLATSLDDAQRLADEVDRSGLFFGLTHNYTGYPLVREARSLVADGRLGPIRVVQVEYPQDWLATREESGGNKQAEWRTDPKRSGPVGCLGDIGTHAFNLVRFVTGLEVESLSAELTTFLEGRALDDHAQVMLRFAGGARGMLWSSQVAVGHENGLALRVYGERGGLSWRQEEPNSLRFAPHGEAPRLLTRAGPGLGAAAAHATRIPPGHPEGYLEGFAQLYLDCAEQITARLEGREPDPAALLVPTVRDGVDGMRFIDRVLRSSADDGAWTAF